MRGHWRGPSAAAAALVAAGLISGGSAAAAPRGACKGRAAQPPNVGSHDFLTGVDTTSACNAWAVGYHFVKGDATRPLIEHWNGQAWKIEPTPNPGGSSRLMGVAATSSTNAWAVGGRPGGALIEHWNGRAWKIQRSPCHGCSLGAVAATSARNAWAVGSGQGPGFTLIEHWNGRAWKVQRSVCPLSADTCNLSAVAATSATNAWAVGDYDDRTTGGQQLTLIEHWNGKAWKMQPSATPGGLSGALAGVAATSASNAWAVGSYTQQGTGTKTLVEHWNGHTWMVQASPNPGGPRGSELNGVTASSPTNVWAVGDIHFTNGPDRTLIERWNGKAWKAQPSPNHGPGSNALAAVAATSATDAWAVGTAHRPGRGSRALALRWNGNTWGA